MHAQNNMKGTAYILHSLLNDFSMFKVRIWYEKNTVHKNIPDSLGIKYIHCGKTIGCTSDNSFTPIYVLDYQIIWDIFVDIILLIPNPHLEH